MALDEKTETAADDLTSTVGAATDIAPLENPGILSIPLEFLGAIIGTSSGRKPQAEASYHKLPVRASTGLGAEQATKL